MYMYMYMYVCMYVYVVCIKHRTVAQKCSVKLLTKLLVDSIPLRERRKFIVINYFNFRRSGNNTK